MENTKDCEFVLLGGAPSNLAARAYPFVVVINEVIEEGCSIRSYVLNGWQNIRQFFPDDIREDVIFFLESLSKYATGQSSESFFLQLQELSVGPIRTLSNGRCNRDELDLSIAEILDAGEDAVLWPDSFHLLGERELGF